MEGKRPVCAQGKRRHSNNTNIINTNNLNIKVTITPMKERDGCLKANASIILNDVFKVTGIRIGISQKENIFVSMPDYKTGRLDDNGKDVYQDIAYPVTRQFRQELYDEIVKEFSAVMGWEEQQAREKRVNGTNPAKF